MPHGKLMTLFLFKDSSDIVTSFCSHCLTCCVVSKDISLFIEQ